MLFQANPTFVWRSTTIRPPVPLAFAPSRAIVARNPLPNGGWKLENVTVREPAEGELLVEMVASGICHTDALIGGLPHGAGDVGFYPRVLGHEGTSHYP